MRSGRKMQNLTNLAASCTSGWCATPHTTTPYHDSWSGEIVGTVRRLVLTCIPYRWPIGRTSVGGAWSLLTVESARSLERMRGAKSATSHMRHACAGLRLHPSCDHGCDTLGLLSFRLCNILIVYKTKTPPAGPGRFPPLSHSLGGVGGGAAPRAWLCAESGSRSCEAYRVRYFSLPPPPCPARPLPFW